MIAIFYNKNLNSLIVKFEVDTNLEWFVWLLPIVVSLDIINVLRDGNRNLSIYHNLYNLKKL